jgi:glucosamine kinase
MIEYLLAVDGGGTGTRVIVARLDGTVLARGEAGPSALGQGVAAAWLQIQQAITSAFAQTGLDHPAWQCCALAAGLSGVHNARQRQAFLDLLPPLGKVLLETDGYTMLIGAHAGQPGVMVAAGTGSVGEVLRSDGSHDVVSGWGFPVGDEGSGAWLGLNAVRIAMCAMDGRAPVGGLAQGVWAHCGANRQEMAAWAAQSAQFAYAQVAPLVFECAESDPAAANLLAQAARDLESIALALDPEGHLPVAICGSIGNKLNDRMSPALRRRCVKATIGPVEGALWLLQKSLEEKP